MGLFSFSNASQSVRTLIDISASSVGGAYAIYAAGKPPALCYTERVAILPRPDEEWLPAMLRSLSFLEARLIQEGAPELRKETGSGAAGEVIVSVGSPWQETRVQATRIEEKRPFVFTREHVKGALARTRHAKEGRMPSGEALLATTLNGYATGDPYGKRALRAEIVTLSSSIDEEAGKAIRASLRKAFHTKDIALAALAPVSLAAVSALYPHQQDLMVMMVSRTSTDIAVMKRRVLSDVRSLPLGTDNLETTSLRAGSHAHPRSVNMLDGADAFVSAVRALEDAWLSGLHAAFAELSRSHTLPRTIFLIAEPDEHERLKRLLRHESLAPLWISDQPVSVIALAEREAATLVSTRGKASGDLSIAFLACYARPEAG